MIDGEKMKLGDAEYVVPPLTLRQVRKLHESGVMARVPASNLGLLVSIENLDAAVELISQALSRNYPGIAREEIEDAIDMRNVQPAISAALAAPGLEAAKGEAKAGQ